MQGRAGKHPEAEARIPCIADAPNRTSTRLTAFVCVECQTSPIEVETSESSKGEDWFDTADIYEDPCEGSLDIELCE